MASPPPLSLSPGPGPFFGLFDRDPPPIILSVPSALGISVLFFFITTCWSKHLSSLDDPILSPPERQSARPSNLIFPSLHSPSRLSSLVSRAAAVDLSRALASLLISSGGVGRLLLPIERCESNRLKASQDCSLSGTISVVHHRVYGCSAALAGANGP